MSQPDWPPIQWIWTIIIIGICSVLMLLILIDLSRKFWRNAHGTITLDRSQTVASSSNINRTTSPSTLTATSPTLTPSMSTSRSSSKSPRLRRKRSKRGPKVISPFYKYTTLLSISTFTGAVVIDLGDGIYYFETGINVFMSEHHWAVVLTNVLLLISTMSLYIFMFGRLVLSFKDSESKYRLSTGTMVIIPGLIVLNIGANIFYISCMALLTSDEIDLFTFYVYLEYSFQVILALDFILCFSMLSLMVWKLHQVTLSLDVDTAQEYEQMAYTLMHTADRESRRKRSIQLNSPQIKIITVMTRHS